ncbi:MAG: HEAT repeat domain-containing protein [Planctomycetota bacterium]|jgi:hypothetical protein
MESEKKKEKRKQSFVFPLVLLAVLVAGIIVASIVIRPARTEKTRERQPIVLQIDALIIGLARDEDWVDRNRFITELRKVTGMYFGYHPESTEERRREELNRWNDWWNSVKAKYADREPEKIDWLLDALESGDYRWKNVIIPVIGESGNHRAVEPLIKALEAQGENSSSIRLASARALGEIGNASAIPALIKASSDADRKVGRAAADSIVRFRQKGHLDQILKASMNRDLDISVRFELLVAAFSIDNSASEAAAIAFCRDAAGERNADFFLKDAISMLATCGTAASIGILETLSSHSNPVIHRKAGDVLGRIRKRLTEGAPR